MLHILFIFLISVSSAFCTFLLGVEGQANAEATATVTWTRDPTDPLVSSIAKVKLDEQTFLTSEPFVVPTPQAVAGRLLVPFNRAGIFHLIAYDGSKRIISTSDQFGVNPPNRLVSENLDAAPTSSPTRTIEPTSTMRQSQSAGAKTRKPKNQTPVIVGTVLGCVFAILFFTVLFIFIRNRRNRRRAAAYREEMVARMPSYNFGTIIASSQSSPIDDPEKTLAEMSFASPTTTTRDRSKAERQYEIGQRITELERMISSLKSMPENEDGLRVWKMIGQVENLKTLKNSPWAQGLTDTVPEELR